MPRPGSARSLLVLLALPLTSAAAQSDQPPYPSTAAICGETLPAHTVDPLLALEPALADSVRFAECLAEGQRHQGIDADIAIARDLRLTGTPSIAINGVLYRTLPGSGTLHRIVDQELATARTKEGHAS